MIVKYYVTWAPKSAEAGMAFLTTVDGEIPLKVRQIMERALDIEDIDPDEPYEIYSIIQACGYVNILV